MEELTPPRKKGTPHPQRCRKPAACQVTASHVFCSELESWEHLIVLKGSPDVTQSGHFSWGAVTPAKTDFTDGGDTTEPSFFPVGTHCALRRPSGEALWHSPKVGKRNFFLHSSLCLSFKYSGLGLWGTRRTFRSRSRACVVNAIAVSPHGDEGKRAPNKCFLIGAMHISAFLDHSPKSASFVRR